MESLTSNISQENSYYSTNKWLYYPDRVACVKRGDFRKVMPVTVQLVPSLYCNFNCPHCCYGRAKENIKSLGKRNAMLMEYHATITVIDRLSDAGVKGVVFTGGGEPTTHPQLINSMHYAKQKGMKIGLFTNGSLLTARKVQQLLELEPTFIRISLDAGTPEIHRLLHGYSTKQNYFPRVLENIKLLAKGRVYKRTETTIGVGVTVEPVNLNDLDEVAKRLHEISHHSPVGGIDYVVFRPTVNYQGGKIFQATQQLLEHVKGEMPEYYESYFSYLYTGQQLPAQTFEKASQIIDNKVSPLLNDTGIQVINVRTKMQGVNQSHHPFQKCRASSWYIFVGPDGTVYNCAELGLDPRAAIGNLLRQSLDQIWKSQQRKEVMDFIDQDGLLTLCPPVCLYYELNNLFEKLDEASQTNSTECHEILKWVRKQEDHIQTEMTSGAYSQQHREFM